MDDAHAQTPAPDGPQRREAEGGADTAADTRMDTGAAYQVLARKYRPQTFAELIGQDALVRTLTNAIAQNRIAQAFILTGVRGIGKTTTARILARALNCIGPDGKGGPTASPCGQCVHCLDIAADRHVDVTEMDAASRTGVDDVRDIIEAVRYRPVSARYRVFIIDEVHMLSKNAFNALLKTLEEPPAHVKFVFATTEIRKVPVTVLSRCQRFDLKRLDLETLAAHLADIASREKAEVTPEALAMIARAAEGSVRDGLSLLDQAIAVGVASGSGAGGPVTAEQVRDMLGLADRSQLIDLFDVLMKGKIEEALALAGELYRAGADPVTVIQDLLDLTHWLTRLKIVPEAAEGAAVAEAERARAHAIADALPMPALTRAWQMLMKGLGEVQVSHAPATALEMALIRLAYAAELPVPAEIIKSLETGGAPAGTIAPAAAAPRPASPPAAPVTSSAAPQAAPPAAPPTGPGGTALKAQPEEFAAPDPEEADKRQQELLSGEAEASPETVAEAPPPPDPQSFAEVAELLAERREGILYAQLVKYAHPVRFESGLIEFRSSGGAPTTLASRVAALLTQWTGRRWAVNLSQEEGEPTLAEQAAAREAERRDKAAQHPLVRAVLDTFPGAEIDAVRDGRGGTDDMPQDAAAGDEEDE